MSEMKIGRQSLRWSVVDNLCDVQSAPLVTDPETLKWVDPIDIRMEYHWYPEGWVLVAAEVRGMEVVDGECPHEDVIVCDFYDPVEGEEGLGGGKAPQWLIDRADKRMAVLPAPLGSEAEPETEQ